MFAMEETQQTDGQLDRPQQLLMEIRDKLCGGNSAELARRIEKDSTYVNRLFYPEGKAGRKGIGLAIMAACNRAFHLPTGFWDRDPPALTASEVKRIKFDMAMGRGDRRADEPIAVRIERVLSKIALETDLEEIEKLKAELQRLTFRQDVEHRREIREANHAAEPPVAYGMAPILAWEHPDDLPPGDFVMIPRLDVHLSAGNGQDQVEIELTKENPQAFRTEWIRQMRLKPNKLAAMRASGESMEPTIHDSDSLLVDTSQIAVVDGKVYALWYEGGERVKRLFRLPGGGLRIVSDNPRHAPIELGSDYTGHVRIIGRVVHRSGTGGL